MDDIMAKFVSGDGLFSVAVTAFLLVRMENRLEKLTEILTELKVLIGGVGVDGK